MEPLRIERPHYQPDREECEQDQQAEDIHVQRLRRTDAPSLADRTVPAKAQASCASVGAGTTSLTFSRSSLPALKCGTCLPGRATDSPVFGLRPMRGGGECNEKLPNPRISIRSADASEPAIIASSDLTARSTSSAFRCDCRRARISISSDLVISY